MSNEAARDGMSNAEQLCNRDTENTWDLPAGGVTVRDAVGDQRGSLDDIDHQKVTP